MSNKKQPVKRLREPSISPTPQTLDTLPDVALAAIVSSKKQRDVSEFLTFLLDALERNSKWVNSIVNKQNDFRCALMVGSGPNRFQMQEIIYPSTKEDISLEVELKESDDHDKVAIAAILKLSILEMNYLMDYLKTRLRDNVTLQEDLRKGKELGVSFAVLRPISDKQYRIMDRIVICGIPRSPKKIETKPLPRAPFKKAKRLIV